MSVLLNFVLILVFVSPPLLALAAFLHCFSSFRRRKKESRDTSHGVKKYLFFTVISGVFFLGLLFLSVFYAILLLNGRVIM